MTAPIQAQRSSGPQLIAPRLALVAPPVEGEGDLLPPPGTLDRAQIQDAMSMLFLIMNAKASTDLASSEGQIAAQKKVKEEALREQLEALRRASEAVEGGKGFFESIGDMISHSLEDLATFDIEGTLVDPWKDMEEMWNSPKFWSDVAAGAAVVAEAAVVIAAVAAVIASGGAAGPVVALIAVAVSAGGMAIEKTDCLDGVLGEGASDGIGIGMEIAGSVTGGGAMAFAGSAAQAATWATTVEKVANTSACAATVAKGASIERTAKFQGDAEHLQGDALSAQHKADRITRLVEQLLASIKEVESSHQRAKETLTEAIQGHDQTQLAAIFTTGRQAS